MNSDDVFCDRFRPGDIVSDARPARDGCRTCGKGIGPGDAFMTEANGSKECKKCYDRARYEKNYNDIARGREIYEANRMRLPYYMR